MIRTKHFLVASIGLIIGVLILWVLNVDTEVSPSDTTTSVVFIASEPQEFSIMKDSSDNSKIKRAIFIEKIRNVLKRNPPPPEPVEPEYVAPTFSLPETNLPSVPPIVPTTTDVLPTPETPTTTPSTTSQTLPIN